MDDKKWDTYYREKEREMNSVASAILTSSVTLWINLQFVHHLETFSNVYTACSWSRFYGQLETCKLQTLLGDSNIKKTKKTNLTGCLDATCTLIAAPMSFKHPGGGRSGAYLLQQAKVKNQSFCLWHDLINTIALFLCPSASLWTGCLLGHGVLL